MVFATSLVSEHLHGSPVIAVVVAGVSLSNERHAQLEPSRVLALSGFWRPTGFVLNVWLFLLVGVRLRPIGRCSPPPVSIGWSRD